MPTAASSTQVLLIGLMFLSFIAWLLVPLLPAILIRRALPDDKISVNGPLHGLTVSATGGIGTYLLLVVTGYFTLSQTLWPAINRLDDGSWTFEIPVIAQDKNGNALLLENGGQISAEIQANPQLTRPGMIGYSAVLRTTRIDGRLPMVRLVVRMPGAEAKSEPIDLESEMAKASPQERKVKLPLQPLRVEVR